MSYGDWEEGENKRAGHDGKGKERKGVGSRLFPLPIVPRALSNFRLLQYFSLFLLGYSRGICGERE